MKIGELSHLTDISTSRIRFYEKHGLIPETARKPNGYRDYSDDVIERLRTISICQTLGFSLAEIKRALPENPGDGLKCDDVIAQLNAKLADVHAHIADLHKLKRKLTDTLQHFETVKAQGRHVDLKQLEP